MVSYPIFATPQILQISYSTFFEKDALQNGHYLYSKINKNKTSNNLKSRSTNF